MRRNKDKDFNVGDGNVFLRFMNGQFQCPQDRLVIVLNDEIA